MKIIFVIVTGLIVLAMGFTITYAHGQFLDLNTSDFYPETNTNTNNLTEAQFDQYNPDDELTKICNDYVNSYEGLRAPDAQVVLMCSDYLNQTMLDKFGIVK